jgi:dihydropteroate synthase
VPFEQSADQAVIKAGSVFTDLPDLQHQIQRRLNNYLFGVKDSKQRYGLDLAQPCIMGILNVTPDSFSDGGRYLDTEKAVSHALEMKKAGAAIIDIGGESSRPGAETIGAEEELKRVLPVIMALRKKSDVLISIDTCKAAVAEKALAAGADWINDISATRADAAMVTVAKKYDCPLVVMHMLGTPQTMQKDPFYQNVCLEVNDFFEERIAFLRAGGIEKILLDPGIGFGKRLEDNLDLIRCCAFFKQHGFPLVTGTSRKSFIGQITAQTTEKRLAGSLASLYPALEQGVNIVRVHDVAETADLLKMWRALK